MRNESVQIILTNFAVFNDESQVVENSSELWGYICRKVLVRRNLLEEKKKLGQQAFVVTNDIEVRDKIAQAFGFETNLVVIAELAKAIEFLENNHFHVVIIDAKTTDIKVHYSENKEIISFLEIAQHHEHYDGSGFPLALSGTLISLEAALSSVLGSFDHFNILRNGDKTKTLTEVWDLVKVHHTTTQFKKKFHPEILKKLDDFFDLVPSN